MNAEKMALAGLAAILLAAGGALAVNIETVPVGNLGNAADTRYETPGCGAVGYVYNIGKYEVTNAQYAEFLNAVATVGDPHGLYNTDMASGYGGITQGGSPGNYTYSVLQGRANKPVNYVSFWDACRFANWLHNGQGAGDTEMGAYTLTPDGITNNTVTRNLDWKWAVTSDDEWYKAAYYDGGSSVYYDYPTGSDTAPTAESPAGTDLVNGSANYDLAVGDLTDVGAYTTKPSDSPYGTFDQGGNVWEWNEAIMGASYRGLRGGSFGGGDFTLRAAIRLGISPPYEYGDIGFRVSEVPEPGSASLLVVSAVGLLARRRRR